MAIQKSFRVVDNYGKIPLYKLPRVTSEVAAENWIMEHAEERLGPNLSLSIQAVYSSYIPDPSDQ
jgi:hypothetical protein